MAQPFRALALVRPRTGAAPQTCPREALNASNDANETAADRCEEAKMAWRILIEAETPGDSRAMFRLRIDTTPIADGLTAAQAHLLVGRALERIALPKAALGRGAAVRKGA
jgi:hypothetical protein